MRSRRSHHAISTLSLLAIVFCALLSGCASNGPEIGHRVGPTEPAQVTTEPWTYEGVAAFRMTSPHYTIYTTISDPAFANQIAQVMEAGYSQYQQFTPDLKLSTERMDCYIFAERNQWTDFTKRNTGAVARIYLQINRGGYTLRDWYVAYDIGQFRTFSVAAHEGWHQFAYRNFLGRLPPFLEEGIACMFEDVLLRNDLPKFNLSVNRFRASSLRHAMDSRELIPLNDLVRMHAGAIVGRSGGVIEAFYSENWAFAKFLWEGEHGKYRPALLRLINDTAYGNTLDPTGSHLRTASPWNPESVPPLLEKYLGMSMDELSQHFAAYMHEVAYDQFDEQFAS